MSHGQHGQHGQQDQSEPQDRREVRGTHERQDQQPAPQQSDPVRSARQVRSEAPTPTPAPQAEQTERTPQKVQPRRETHYMKVGTLDTWLSACVAWLSRRGVSLMGSAELSVPGRKSGEMRKLPVNPFPYRGTQYLVSARGHSQWVRNMRAAGSGELRVGRSVKTFTAIEVPEAERPEILRGYLKKWGWEVGRFFNGVTVKSSDEELLAAAPDHPVFRITVTS